MCQLAFLLGLGFRSRQVGGQRFPRPSFFGRSRFRGSRLGQAASRFSSASRCVRARSAASFSSCLAFLFRTRLRGARLS
jgi:hypothetical protein